MKNDKGEVVGIAIIIRETEGNMSEAARGSDGVIRTKSASAAYRDNWEGIFAKKPTPTDIVN